MQAGTVAPTSTDVAPQKLSHVIKMTKNTQRQNGYLITFVSEPTLENTYKLIPFNFLQVNVKLYPFCGILLVSYGDISNIPPPLCTNCNLARKTVPTKSDSVRANLLDLIFSLYDSCVISFEFHWKQYSDTLLFLYHEPQEFKEKIQILVFSTCANLRH